MRFQLKSSFQPTGDQPQAIDQLTQAVDQNREHQVLLGVTGSGKTFTMASVIQNVQKPTLVIAHNKTLAAQLYQEFRDFFPENAVSYFVSYYDYYQPEAYIPSTDTYIEKEAEINDQIEKLRLAATTNLLTRQDVIIIASVSCIYNLGSPVEYGRYLLRIMEGEVISRKSLLLQLANLQYDRSDHDFRRGSYRLRGDTIQLWPAYLDTALKIDTLENRITAITEIDPLSGSSISEFQREKLLADNNQSLKDGNQYYIYPAKHYLVDPKTQEEALAEISQDLKVRLKELKTQGKIIEAYRLEQKVNYDLEMIREFGFVNGIENYSRYFDGRKSGEAPYTLLDYFRENQRQFSHNGFLTVIDESHMTVPQIRGMYRGDRARKQTLVDYGFRLPSAIDNRPLKFNEFLSRNDQIVYVSATPADWEINQANLSAQQITRQSNQEPALQIPPVIEQLVRPTGLVDPEVEVRPVTGQIENLVQEIIKRKQAGQRVLVTTLTKRMAEALTDYLNDKVKMIQIAKSLQYDSKKIAFPKVAYLHSDIETLERSDILADLRRGKYDVVVGINLLREGLDLPEVSLVAILDADKEGFLRSTTALIQTMGRAARHIDGRVILYADQITKSMQQAMDETKRRREIQLAYNQEHQVTPQSISKPIRERMLLKKETDSKYQDESTKGKQKKQVNQKPLVLQLSKKETIDLRQLNPEAMTPDDRKKLTDKLKRKMTQVANDLDFELAAIIRDKIQELQI